MKARFVNENIKNIFKAKSKEEIDDLTKYMSDLDLMILGARKNIPEFVRNYIDSGKIIPYDFLYMLSEENFYYYIDKLVIKNPLYALQLLSSKNNFDMIKEIVNNNYIDFSKKYKNGLTVAENLIKTFIKNTEDTRIIKWLFNHPKIHKHIRMNFKIKNYPTR